ncbi:MAG: phosphoenolpyruvate-protein phosphotransferase [Herbinix sp.]|nr:phosphoenolpyruvate-protein phosphotransferase [Herbinix sp.]
MKAIKVEKTASRGIVIGKAFRVEKPSLKINFGTIEEQDIPKEIKRYESAVFNAEAELEVLAKTNKIFEAHLEMVKDITLYEGVISKIQEEKQKAESALEATAAEFIQIFENMDDEYMRERAADIKDIKYRLMCGLQGVKDNVFEDITEKVILIAEDLTPSDTACLNLNYILGFITQEGGVTSHVSIMAKGLGIPALVGVQGILSKVDKDDTIILDAGEGTILINPDEDTISKYQELQKEQLKKQAELAKVNHLPAITKDGKNISLCANVGNIKDIKKALEYRIDGVGLFRSEFLYMENTHFPTEEEQFEVYKEAAQLCGKELTIRTLDIGGDKALSYYEFEKEDNPFLGWRAIRISLELKDMFKTQLRAILRASAFGIIRIMFPMIISLEELRRSKALLEECKDELRKQMISCDHNIEVGMMIETPASVILAEDFAQEVDFFSIGTNDLTQYLLAVDRGNKKISNMYNSFHPSVIRSIHTVIMAGHKNNIKVGMCGEFASDENAVKLLVGLGLDEFSMSASEVLNVKYMIRNTSFDDAQDLAARACDMQTIQEVYEVLNVKK